MIRLILLLFCFSFLLTKQTYANSCDEVRAQADSRPDLIFKTSASSSGLICSTETDPNYAREQSSCDEAYKKYQELQKSDSPFRKGCRATQAKSVANGGSKSCLVAAEKCSLCIGTSPDEDKDPICQDGAPEEDSDGEGEEEGANSLGEIIRRIKSGDKAKSGQYVDGGNLREMKTRFKYCPLFAKDELDEIIELRKDNEEAKEEGEELLREKVAELKTAKRELSDLQAEQAKIVPEYTEEFQKTIEDQNQKNLAELDKVGKAIVDMILNLQTAEMQFLDAKNTIYKVCFDRAQQAVDRIKEERRAKISAGTLRSQNGFTGLMNMTSTEERLRKYAISVQKRCESRDGQVKKQIQSAERVYGQQLKRLNLQLNDLEKRQRDLSNKLSDAVEDPEEKALLAALKKKYEKRQEEIAKEIAAKMEMIEALTTTIASIQEKLQKNSVDYDSYLAQESLARKAGAKSGDQPTAADFMNAASEYETALDNASRLCGCPQDTAIGDKVDKFGKCKTIQSQMITDFGAKGIDRSKRRGGNK